MGPHLHSVHIDVGMAVSSGSDAPRNLHRQFSCTPFSLVTKQYNLVRMKAGRYSGAPCKALASVHGPAASVGV